MSRHAKVLMIQKEFRQERSLSFEQELEKSRKQMLRKGSCVKV